MIKQVDHIGVAVRSIEQARVVYEQGLGLVCQGEEEVRDQGVRVALFAAGETRIELLEPLSADSPVARFLERRGEGIHHIAYRCDDIQAHLNRLRVQGCRLIDQQPRTGAGGRRIAFIHPGSTAGVLTELCQTDQG